MVLWEKQPLVVFSLDWRLCAYVLHNVTYNLCSQKKHVILIYHEHHKDKYFVLMQQNTIIIQHAFLYKYRYLNIIYIISYDIFSAQFIYLIIAFFTCWWMASIKILNSFSLLHQWWILATHHLQNINVMFFFK